MQSIGARAEEVLDPDYTDRYIQTMEAGEQEHGENRATLVRCALRLFAARGYDGVGVQEIVEAAKVTKPTLYHYFGSKEGLLQAALEEGFAPLERALSTAAEYRNDLTANLAALAHASFRFAEKNSVFCRLLLSLRFAPPESRPFAVVAALNDRQQCIIEDLFKKAVQSHGNMKGRHQTYAASFVGLLNAYIGLYLDGNLRPGAELLHRLVHQYEHGIYS
jgi:AcrR family transcriptional regulator